ncbi:ABC transporter permease [Deinococcus psychrotolerans]|uniref:ABC transporter permease n=1 Tax=Deinococcus psychrotolerans TaxID=2489213 RepID=A0A3G8YAZ4_9DEIO|nr:ABC transporter permease [Deinococcus psychrotolerans]AZI42559.1 ABC transporter permease [Deinococcus psychrotolerans]
MLVFLLRRFLNSIPTLILASMLIFFVIQLAPGDFLTPARLNPAISPQQLENLRRSFGLDQPPVIQYFTWIKNVVQGDLGLSFQYQQPVLAIAWPRILNSLYLVALYLVLFYAIAIPLGVYGAVKQYTLGDKISSGVMYFLLGFPSFFLALIVLYGIVQLRFATGWAIPTGGMTSDNYSTLGTFGRFWDIFKHILLPALVVAVGDVAGFTRILRGQMLEYLRADFVRTARSKGASEFIVIYKHTLRNAIIPFVAGLGGQLPALISGAGFVEVVFAYPGITPMLLDSINARDLYLIAGFNILTVALLIIGNAISDILLSVVDPRIRYS